MPNYEKKIQSTLLQRKIETFLPLHQVVRQWSDRRKTLDVPIFPNYLFVYTTNKDRYPILDVPGVCKFISHDKKPVILCEDQISLIKRIVVEPQARVEEDLVTGDNVEIIEGPLKGLKGIVFEKKGKSRLAVKVEAINQVVSVEIDLHLIRKL